MMTGIPLNVATKRDAIQSREGASCVERRNCGNVQAVLCHGSRNLDSLAAKF